MSYSIDSLTADCYPGTSCLINKLDIRDEEMLAEYEAMVTTAKAALLEQNPLPGSFDFDHYRAIHKFLFEDIYAWAGQLRTVDMSKKGTAFVKAGEIKALGEKAFARLNHRRNFTGLTHEAFVENIVDFYRVINLLHPFREGNGRTQRVFFTQLIRNAGFDIHFAEVDPDELMLATIQAAGGVDDLLLAVFREAIIDSK
jgi:cell filamentation protein